MTCQGEIQVFWSVNDALDNPQEWVGVECDDVAGNILLLSIRCVRRSDRDSRHLFRYHIRYANDERWPYETPTAGSSCVYSTVWCGPLGHQYSTCERVLRLFGATLAWRE